MHSYKDRWRAGVLWANEIYEAYIIDGNTHVDIKEYITPQNCIFNRGTTEGLYNSFSQDSLTLELNNKTHRFDAYNFKGKVIHLELKTESDMVDGVSYIYYTDFYNLTITKATFKDEYITLESNTINVDKGRAGWNVYGTMAQSDPFTNVGNVYTYGLAVLFNYGYMYSSGDITSFQNYITTLPSYNFDWTSYMESARDGITTNADILTQTMQICGGYSYLNKGDYTPYVQISHFPKTTLNNEISAYVYGGCFDEVDYVEEDITIPENDLSDEIDTSDSNVLMVWGEPLGSYDLLLVSGEDRILINNQYENNLPIDVSSYDSIQFALEGADEDFTIIYSLTNGVYRTGDNLDGNTATKDGGNFTIDYLVVDDDVLIELDIGAEYYKPSGIVAVVPNYVWNDGEVTQEDLEVVYGSRTNAIDLTGNDILKLMVVRNGSIPYNDTLSRIYNELNFYSINFEATVTNNLRFETGDVVAISTGVAPTRFSYVENINTDLFGATIISNNRSGE